MKMKCKKSIAGVFVEGCLPIIQRATGSQL
jgi:hypothetical protein